MEPFGDLPLKKFCPDINQIAFYSVAFSMAEVLLVGSAIFAAAVGTTIFVSSGATDRGFQTSPPPPSDTWPSPRFPCT